MPLREFTAEREQRWSVWDVYPTLAERRLRNAGPPPGMLERRLRLEWRPRIRQKMSRGWLAFDAQDGERRRLAPISTFANGWACAPDHELRAWLMMSDHVPPVRRLIE